jgi:hypothetical protein
MLASSPSMIIRCAQSWVDRDAPTFVVVWRDLARLSPRRLRRKETAMKRVRRWQRSRRIFIDGVPRRVLESAKGWQFGDTGYEQIAANFVSDRSLNACNGGLRGSRGGRAEIDAVIKR